MMECFSAIYASLPTSKQVLACSATYTPQLVEFLSRYMHRGQYVSPQSSSDSTVLLGVRQFVSLRPHHVDKLATLRLKEKRLLDLLSSVVFDQCLVFSNLHSRSVWCSASKASHGYWFLQRGMLAISSLQTSIQ